MSISVPFVIEKTARGERSYDIFSKLFEERIIYLSGAIDDSVSNVVVAQLLYLESKGSDKDVDMYINSPGGHVTAGLAIYDTMQFISSDVRTIVTGQACSMGSLLAQAGAPGKRFILPFARTMAHQPIGGYQGQAADIEIHAKEILKAWDNLNEIYFNHNTAGKTREELKGMMERDYFMSAQETIDNGFADSILTTRKELIK